MRQPRHRSRVRRLRRQTVRLGEQRRRLRQPPIVRELQGQRHQHGRGVRICLPERLLLQRQGFPEGRFGRGGVVGQIGPRAGRHELVEGADVARTECPGGQAFSQQGVRRRAGRCRIGAHQTGLHADRALHHGGRRQHAVGVPRLPPYQRHDGDVRPPADPLGTLHQLGRLAAKDAGGGGRLTRETLVDAGPPGTVGRQIGKLGLAGPLARAHACAGLLPGAAIDVGAARPGRRLRAGLAHAVLAHRELRRWFAPAGRLHVGRCRRPGAARQRQHQRERKPGSMPRHAGGIFRQARAGGPPGGMHRSGRGWISALAGMRAACRISVVLVRDHRQQQVVLIVRIADRTE